MNPIINYKLRLVCGAIVTGKCLLSEVETFGSCWFNKSKKKRINEKKEQFNTKRKRINCEHFDLVFLLVSNHVLIRWNYKLNFTSFYSLSFLQWYRIKYRNLCILELKVENGKFIFLLFFLLALSYIWMFFFFTHRYIYVCHPPVARTWCTMPRVKKCIIYILVAAFVHQSMRFFDR